MSIEWEADPRTRRLRDEIERLQHNREAMRDYEIKQAVEIERLTKERDALKASWEVALGARLQQIELERLRIRVAGTEYDVPIPVGREIERLTRELETAETNRKSLMVGYEHLRAALEQILIEPMESADEIAREALRPAEERK